MLPQGMRRRPRKRTEVWAKAKAANKAGDIPGTGTGGSATADAAPKK